LAIGYEVQGDLRFISHHDALRLFQRALARAAIPVRYSAGFNPRPRISIVLPRPVGVASLDELLVVELDQETDPDDVRTRLSAQMPAGLTLTSVIALGAGQRRVPVEAEYCLAFDGTAGNRVRQRVRKLMASERYVIEREQPKSSSRKPIDVRAFVVSIEVENDTVRWVQRIAQDGTVRPNELIEAVGLSGTEHLHRLTRTAVHYAT